MDQLSTASLAGQTYGFALGTALAALLLVLVCRSGGMDRRPRFLFAVCILIANCSGLAKNIALLLGFSHQSDLVLQIRSVGFSAAAMLPLSIMVIWRNNAISKGRRKFGNALVYYGAASGVLIAAALTLGAWGHTHRSIANLTFYNGLALVVLGGIVLLPGTLGNTLDRVAVTLMIAGLFLSSIGAILDDFVSLPASLAPLIEILKFQSIGLVVVGALFYFSRFRAADVFAKQALRLVAGAVVALLASLVILGPVALIGQTDAPGRGARIVAAAILVGCAMLLYGRVAKWTDIVVERRIFGKPDARLANREFRDRLGLLDSRSEVLIAMQTLAAQVLGMKPEELLIQEGIRCNEELTDLAIPIPFQGDALQLVVSLMENRKILLTAEIDFLQEIALQAGRRLDELGREEERIESIRLEGRLSQQLAQAELRALRAQINPHFLFNSLNTIAALIATEPEKAETITVRLASIFRYVLLHTDRPLSSLDEEMGFLRTYLDIEQIRFGERLLVEFDVESSITHTAVPTLILQPLVENAIKHGIAPKVGKSRILVRAKRQRDSILLSVEDDGIGLSGQRDQNRRSLPGAEPGAGVGLQNIRERLKTMYGGDAILSLVDIRSGGSRVTLEIPIAEERDADSCVPGR
jgi:two-component system, LytTR family, sensor kinase